MTMQDQILLALTAWRENRGGRPQPDAMQSIINVILNRVKLRGTDPYRECVRPLQFSSITSKGNPELVLWPAEDDMEWQQALTLAAQAASGTLMDITGGADLYYAPASLVRSTNITLPDGNTVPFPNDWNKNVIEYTATIGDQIFWK